MKCQILFSRKNITSLSSVEFPHSIVSVTGNTFFIFLQLHRNLSINIMTQVTNIDPDQLVQLHNLIRGYTVHV